MTRINGRVEIDSMFLRFLGICINAVAPPLRLLLVFELGPWLWWRGRWSRHADLKAQDLRQCLRHLTQTIAELQARPGPAPKRLPNKEPMDKYGMR